MAYRNPTPTVDIIIELIDRPHRPTILIERLNIPYGWALPGGFVDENEDLEQAARRELFEETNIETGKLTQIGAFGTPNRDPRGHMISIAYQSELIENQIIKAKDDAKEAKWFSIKDLPDLAFDHLEIITSIL